MSKKPEPEAHHPSFANDKSTALPLELSTSNHPQPPSTPRKGNKNETER